MKFEVDEKLILNNPNAGFDTEVIFRGLSNGNPFVFDPKTGNQFETKEEFLKKTTSILYPNVKVKLVGEDGNIFSICGRVTKALRFGGARKEELDKFFDEIMDSNSYDQALQVVMRWVKVN